MEKVEVVQNVAVEEEGCSREGQRKELLCERKGVWNEVLMMAHVAKISPLSLAICSNTVELVSLGQHLRKRSKSGLWQCWETRKDVLMREEKMRNRYSQNIENIRKLLGVSFQNFEDQAFRLCQAILRIKGERTSMKIQKLAVKRKNEVVREKS